MSEETGSKTEEPTRRRFEEARKEGRVAKSEDLTAAGGLLLLLGLLAAGSYAGVRHLESLLLLPAAFWGKPFADALNAMIGASIETFLLLVLPVIAAAAVGSAGSAFLQVGPLFAPKVLRLDWKRLDPMKRLKELFSVRKLFELARFLVKTTLLSLILFLIVWEAIDPAVHLPAAGFTGIVSLSRSLLMRLSGLALLVFLLIAAADFLFQRWQYRKDLRMTKRELKEEFKETEGSPEFKGRRQQLVQELALYTVYFDEALQGAAGVIAGLPRGAVAIRREAAGPVIAAMGTGEIGRLLLDHARGTGLRIVENPRIAEALLTKGQLYEPVSDDLAAEVEEALRS
ncbi:MAG: EscU/YscU/HrcU family type III secretion system export apparatus switch protein [Methylacidiphilaceae bacterium]|nr:EscU/YscU/HrcU family type III secretion system export apparatus switch protein [Candidatus Methylacidiphilaceae bacterium]